MRNAVTINTGKDEEHIVSVILYARPTQRVVIELAMDTLPGVERVVQDELGKYVVVISAPTARRVMQQIEALQAVEGVLSVTMVAHHTEEAEFLSQEIELSSLFPAQADPETANIIARSAT
ncbi:chaperone NapD [Reinekea sp.]|jgi:nitrate reductase NapD|uniref:chaperone NapD n=1 Tax=Reinekea sp. TaxID=1970455 RepID=UPI002A81C280|nr:chaperone NapD [Reinekea sp.]